MNQETKPQLMALCATNNELAQDVEALLPPDVFKKLQGDRKLVVEHTKQVAQLQNETQRKEGNILASVFVVGSTDRAVQDTTEGLMREESPLNSPTEDMAEPTLVRGQKQIEEEKLGDVNNILGCSNDDAGYSEKTYDESREEVDIERYSNKQVKIVNSTKRNIAQRDVENRGL
ncbi:hypothetical protein HPB51_010376 [Rhipicephalus microplus]|uniref:Uncharacterized protein n=1 Tax=Rhipicephalus microplus TaxID=6941 RepID=A0A9J6EH42_RHIMP|nr:hypothetical protein HPB51_010376 [Rhipicephalus microplus]